MTNTLEFSFDKNVPPEDLHKLMLQTGWGKGRSVEGLSRMLSMSTLALGVWDGGRLVGFGRAMSDGTYRALIEDIIVDEPYRNKGIGSKIMQMLTDRLSNVEDIYLFTGMDMESYYNRFGFVVTPFLSMRLLPKEPLLQDP